ncbi:MAG: GNAT family N-acetyltransferase [Erysipelotrichaceae bacterium]
MITIRAYQESDFSALANIHDPARLDELEAAGLLDAFLPFVDTYENEGLFSGDVWVALINEQIVGFIAYHEQEITWLYVAVEVQSQGVGRALLEYVYTYATKPITIEVLVGNRKALRLYQNVGAKQQEIKAGKLTGNESFAASAHILVWE